MNNPTTIINGREFTYAINAIMKHTDRLDKDRPVVRAEHTMNKSVVEMLRVGRPATRRARAMAAVEVIRARVAEAYGVEGEAA